MGFSDARLGKLTGSTADEVHASSAARSACARCSSASTPAPPSSPRRPPTCIRPTRRRSPARPANEAAPSDTKKVIILGGGPNRIGQGIEFDYCCCHACFALHDAGYETIMINCNPETVSTDYDTSDRLYFEPLTAEDVLEIVDTEQSNGTLHGVIVQFGGQTPLKLAEALEKAKVPILGTSPDAIDLAEDRDRFKQLLDKLKLRQPQNGIATQPRRRARIAEAIGYPVVIRPSYVLGGRAMEIVHDAPQLDRYLARLTGDLDRPSELVVSAKRPLLIDRYLSDADRGRRRLPLRRQGHLHRRHHGAYRGGRHPFRRLRPARCRRTRSTRRLIAELERQTRALALALKVGGLMNVQYAIKDGDIYVLEVNPRASRTVPFVAKVDRPAGRQDRGARHGRREARLLQAAAADLRPETFKHVGVKEAVFPFARFGASTPCSARRCNRPAR